MASASKFRKYVADCRKKGLIPEVYYKGLRLMVDEYPDEKDDMIHYNLFASINFVKDCNDWEFHSARKASVLRSVPFKKLLKERDV